MFFDIVSLGYKKFFYSLLKLFNFKEKTRHMTIAELKAYNLLRKNLKAKWYLAYISEINQRHNKMRIN